MKNSWIIFFCLVTLNAQISYTISNELKYGDGKSQGQVYLESYDYFEDLLEINFYYENYNLFLQWEYSDPPPFGYSLRKLNKGFLEYESDNYRIVMGDLYTLYGRGIGINMFQDQNLDFDNSVRGIELDYTKNDNFRIFGLSGRGEFGFKSGKNLTGRENDVIINNNLSALGLEITFPYIPGDWMFLNINLNSSLPPIIEEGIPEKSLSLDINNYGYSTIIGPFDIYFEQKDVKWKDDLNPLINDEGIEEYFTGYMKYAAFGTAAFGYGLTLDYKNYYMPNYEYTISNPPIVLMESSSPLIARNIHIINLNDEQGYQFELVKQFGELNFIYNNSLSFRHNGEYEFTIVNHTLEHQGDISSPSWILSDPMKDTLQFSKPTISEVLSFNNDPEMFSFWPYHQYYTAIYGYLMEDNFFYKIGLDKKNEILSYHPTIIYEDSTDPDLVAKNYWWNKWEENYFPDYGIDSLDANNTFNLIYGSTVEEKIQTSIEDYQNIKDTLLLTDFDYENQSAITIPTQFSYKFENGSSITSYIEIQSIDNNFIRDNIHGSYKDESPSYSQEIDNNYFSLSYRSPEKWSLTVLYDREKIIQNGEKYSDKEWPGIDFSMDIDDSHQFSIFYGSQRGGLICANGVCAYQPAFEDGFKISFKSLF